MPRPRDKPHARIYDAWTHLLAWTTLKPPARSLLIMLLVRYRPAEPNRFEVSDRTAAALANCSRGTAAKALAELEDRGWIEVIRVGKMRGPKARRASVYALTYYPRLVGERASQAFLTWRPQPVQRLKIDLSTAHFRATNGLLQSRNLEKQERADAS